MYTVDEQLPQPHRNSTNCDRHSDGYCTGFCPSCLFERLTVLDHSSSLSASNPNTTAARKSTSSTLRSLGAAAVGERTSSRIRPGPFLPELRRSKSFTGVKNQAGSGFAGICGPQRKSCDPRARNSLLIQDDGGEIEEIDEPIGWNYIISNPKLSSEEQMGTPEKVNKKTTKKTIVDLDAHTKERPGSLWSAASLFSKKLKAWTTKNSKLMKHSGKGSVRAYKKSNAGRNYKEGECEVGDYGYGRRSNDIDGRFCMDGGRMSFEDPRYSFEEARASCDGYLVGGGRVTNLPRIMPCMVSLMEDPSPRQPSKLVLRKGKEGVPGGPDETNDYYLDSSSSRRRKSLDRSNSMKTNSLRNDCCENFDCRDSASVIDIASDRKIGKKWRSWKSWNIWGFIARRYKDEDDDRNGWQEVGREFNRNGFRSNSSVSWRN